MAEEDTKILGTWLSPFVMRTMIALNLKGVEYQIIEETASPKSELLLKVNPVYKKIPVLIHANRPVCESLITVQYIDEAWSSGPTILPSDPYEQAMARFWGAYIDDEWFPAFHGVSKMKGEEVRKASLERVLEGVQLLEGAYQDFSKVCARPSGLAARGGGSDDPRIRARPTTVLIRSASSGSGARTLRKGRGSGLPSVP